MPKLEFTPKKVSINKRLSGAFQAIILCLFAMPAALFVTILFLPLWSWLESSMNVEAVGHSGPAEWCYLSVYLVLIAIAGFTWSRLERRRENK